MYSQNEEEQFITGYFGGFTGRFLDIGAYDGKLFSNTLRLVELGWSGVCVEPSPGPFSKLVKQHEGRPVKCIQAAITLDRDGPVRFWQTDDAVSTTVSKQYQVWKDAAAFIESQVPGMALATLLAAEPGPYQMVNIDTEGTSVDLAKALPWVALGVRLLCVEHDGLSDDLIGAFPGFRETCRNAENIILVRA